MDSVAEKDGGRVWVKNLTRKTEMGISYTEGPDVNTLGPWSHVLKRVTWCNRTVVVRQFQSLCVFFVFFLLSWRKNEVYTARFKVHTSYSSFWARLWTWFPSVSVVCRSWLKKAKKVSDHHGKKWTWNWNIFVSLYFCAYWELLWGKVTVLQYKNKCVEVKVQR